MFHKEIVHPYLDEKFLDFVLQIPIDERMRNGVRKGLLREVARRLGLGEIASLDKKAAQYGSGIMKTMKKAARKRKIHLKELVEQNSDSRKQKVMENSA
ncbi:MAG: asparagine synthase C-terminal domain-containing protein [Methanomassiliicoccales archaeon]